MPARGAPVPWTSGELDTLRRLYPSDMKACVAALTRHTREAVQRKARVLGICNRPKHWTDIENARLRRLWAYEVSIARLSERFGRTQWAVYEHARELGLPFGLPQGYEYFKDASKRTGFHEKSLWMIVRWAEVVTRSTRTKPGLGRTKRYYVDPDEVDDAIRRWMETETVAGAARRVGMSSNGLRYWLLKAGVLQSSNPRNSRHHRIPSSVIDGVVAQHRTAA